MNWYKRAQSYTYIGNCKDTVDKLQIWDATQMAQLVENSEPFDINKILRFVDEKLTQKIINNPHNFECGKYGSIVWIYDSNSDIHYFFEEII